MGRASPISSDRTPPVTVGGSERRSSPCDRQMEERRVSWRHACIKHACTRPPKQQQKGADWGYHAFDSLISFRISSISRSYRKREVEPIVLRPPSVRPLADLPEFRV